MIIRIAYNYDTGTKLENSYYLVLKKIQLGFSSKIEMHQLGSAQLGKFQLELNTNMYVQVSLIFNALA